jgi:membrane-associated phospholipid phosphatase
MKQKIASIISGVLNPFLVCFITIMLLVAHATDTLSGALKWGAVAMALSVLPVLVFVLVQVRRKKLESIFPEERSPRRMIYALASVLAAAGLWVMWYFGAPRLLEVSFLAGLLAVIVFMVINFFWKISLHASFVASSATVLTIIFGAKAAWMFLLLPLIGWARVALKVHTVAQVAAGAVLAVVIVTCVFWGFGVI